MAGRRTSCLLVTVSIAILHAASAAFNNSFTAFSGPVPVTPGIGEKPVWPSPVAGAFLNNVSVQALACVCASMHLNGIHYSPTLCVCALCSRMHALTQH